MYDLSGELTLDTHHCLVVANVRERLAVSQHAGKNFDVNIFNLRKISELEFRKQYRINISNRFADVVIAST